MSERAAGVMRMSVDDDDQTDQQHELVDPGMGLSSLTLVKYHAAVLRV